MAAIIHKLAILPNDSFLRNVKVGTDFTHVDNVVVTTAGTPVSYTVPAGTKAVVFGASGNFVVRPRLTGGSDATKTTTSNGTGCEINPAGFYFASTVNELSFDAFANGTTISVTCYS